MDEGTEKSATRAPMLRIEKSTSMFKESSGSLSKLQVAVIRQLRKNLKTLEGEKVLREESRHQKRMRHLRSQIWSQMNNEDAVDKEKLEFLFSLHDIQDLGVIDEHQFASIMQDMSIPMYTDEVFSTFQDIQAVCDDRLSKRALTEWFLDEKKKLSNPETSATSWLRGKVGPCAQFKLRLWNWWRLWRGQTDKRAALLTLHKAAILEAKQVADDVASKARVKLREAFTDLAYMRHAAISPCGDIDSSPEPASGPEYDNDLDDTDQYCLIGFDLYGSK